MKRQFRALGIGIGALCLVASSALPQVAHAASTQGIAQVREAAHGSESSPAPVSSVDLAKQAKSAVLMDFATGKVLYAKNAHERLPMASITKIMTLLLIFEALDSGKLKWTDRVQASERAASMGGSQIFLEPNETMTVRDLVKGIAIASANDACVAMAEHLDGSEEAFVARMNQRAKELGMSDTHFSNCNGLPAPNHYSSAHDIAVMSRALLMHPEITQFTSVYSDYLRKDTDHPLWLVNTNKLVRFYDGVDGLKTGYTQEAKYCLSATAKRDGFRVIAVVMGEPKPTVRNAEVSGMLNYAFAHYKAVNVYPQGHVIGTAQVKRGTRDRVEAVTAEPVAFVAERSSKADYTTEVQWMTLTAPVKRGQTVGRVIVKCGHQVVANVPLVAKEDVPKATFFQSLGKTMKKIITFGQAQ
ncbi:D-alanyl-D-alanine carboxypeptidase family protein [Alicyclobacillus vulcanalis]|uniref:serine-type D-Ala-D-Ala carboxypeptidase n=1 Tax=Alicyclobacillus vulcanalis TaxID=252246 RepID=A0A1N7KLP5_9BACL|nr:D-alanyl-D-alanine carboxypeptidase family protein [Alicyclobacillus vulcanalis]SIS62503.1 D-alanyl-D-alanine carboxypeptidase (penicillin-binding protein 5/6) [Alicyclobacillus vulcanalis]